MAFLADLHVHSKYSRATSKHADLEHLAFWGARKGIGIVATGDFTHPAWRAELGAQLVPAEPGLFRLTPELERRVTAALPAACRSLPRFMLSVEISTIYKKGDRTRKIHHLIYVPDFAAADRVIERLEKIGNIRSDGRPILGLDSRHLLEIVLESGPDSYLVPAHIWTPWFAALGSKSGFDSVADCYGDLADHIFAVETGLSSDPVMNWRVSSLDRYRLVSNSDAHSPEKLGREACTFDTALDYFALRRALETGDGYRGTVEFFPEEGKYHLDGHRKCDVRLTPEETRAHEGLCPVCAKPVTVGVMHRVHDLADRADGEAPPDTAGTVRSLVPLAEILAEIQGVGPKSQGVLGQYDALLNQLGPELSVLGDVPLDDVRKASSSLVAEALARLRRGEVRCEAGFDGEYGVVRLFQDEELLRRTVGAALFDLAAPAAEPSEAQPAEPPRSTTTDEDGSPAPAAHRDETSEGLSPAGGVDAGDPRPTTTGSGPAAPLRATTAPNDGDDAALSTTSKTAQPASSAAPDESAGTEALPAARKSHDVLARLDADQRRAAEAPGGPLLIVAGPGAGKTRTLTHRVAHLVADRGVRPDECLAITFTRRAADEMRQRLTSLLGEDAPVTVSTFHALGLAILEEQRSAAGLQRGFRVAGDAERLLLAMELFGVNERRARRELERISRAKREGVGDADGDVATQLVAYRDAMESRNLLDWDDLVGRTVELLDSEPGLAATYRERHPWVFVDEYQDVDPMQYRLVRLLSTADGNLCVIGDPDQAIYGFRGADVRFFDRFRLDFPDAQVVELVRNYRSSPTIVAASASVAGTRAVTAVRPEDGSRVVVHEARSEKAEAEFVVHTIEQLVGGHSFFSIDSGRAEVADGGDYSFSDFAVLYRTSEQEPPLVEAFERSGMPFQHRTHTPLLEEGGVRRLVDELGRAGSTGSVAERLRAAAARLRDANDVLPREVDAGLELLLPIAGRCDDDGRFAAEVALATQVDLFDPRADRISLLTLHASKGLEFPVVFMVGCEDGLLPLTFGAADEADRSEERRLFYVGATRAEQRLFLCRAARRPWRGRVSERLPSPFLREIEERLLEHSRTRVAPRPATDAAQLEMF